MINVLHGVVQDKVSYSIFFIFTHRLLAVKVTNGFKFVLSSQVSDNSWLMEADVDPFDTQNRHRDVMRKNKGCQLLYVASLKDLAF